MQNGNVELYGSVDSQADKDVATIRANGVPGVFSVKNFLQATRPSKGINSVSSAQNAPQAALAGRAFFCPP